MGEEKTLTIIGIMNLLYIGEFIESPSKEDILLDCGQLIVRTMNMPNSQVLREALIVGIGGFNKGPIKRMNLRGFTNSIEVSVENLGVGAYKLLTETYKGFTAFRQADETENYNVMQDYVPKEGENITGVTPDQLAALQQSGLMPKV